MHFTKSLWENNLDLALKSLNTKFVRGIGEGSLPKKTFQKYVAQDAFFLESFANAYKSAISKALNRIDLEIISGLLDGVKEELTLHESYANKWGIDLQKHIIEPSTKKYTDFLEKISANSGCTEIMCAMSPCMRLYSWLGKKLENKSINNPYKDWIITYADDDFEELARSLEKLIEKNSENINLDTAHYLYKEAMKLEYEFFLAYSDF